MAEDIKIHRDGVGAKQQPALSSTKEKTWYPFTPDHYKAPQIETDYQQIYLPGGTALGTNQTTNHTIQPNLYGWEYDGSKNSNHINHKYTIFGGAPRYGHTGPNLYNQNDSIIQGYNTQLVGGLLNYGKGYKDSNVASNVFSVYADDQDGYGCPIPVYGITIDVMVGKGLATVSGAGTKQAFDTDNYARAADQQINTVYAHYLNLDTGKYVDKLLLPNGDNWGGKAYGTSQKYIFRNSQNHTYGDGQQILGDDAQFRLTCKDEKSGNHEAWTMKLFLANNAKPPENSIFVGFSVQMTFGRLASQSKSKQVIYNNVGIITQNAMEIMRDKPKYHGTNPSADGLPYFVAPALINARGVMGSKLRLYGPTQNW